MSALGSPRGRWSYLADGSTPLEQVRPAMLALTSPANVCRGVENPNQRLGRHYFGPNFPQSQVKKQDFQHGKARVEAEGPVISVSLSERIGPGGMAT